MIKMLTLIAFLLIYSDFSFSQEIDSERVEIKVLQNHKQNKKREKALDDLLSVITDKVDSVLIFKDRIPLACAVINDTLIYLKIVSNTKNEELKFVIVKLQVTQPIISKEQVMEIYETYVDLTFNRLQVGKWKFYEKKKLPIEFKGYQFVLIEEYSERKVEDVVKKHFR